MTCWYLDIQFFENLIDEFNLDLDYEEIIKEFWNSNLNTFIYVAYEQVKDMFIEQNADEIKRITELSDPYEVNYTIWTNCLDSSIWFKDQEVETLFQNWRSEIGR